MDQQAFQIVLMILGFVVSAYESRKFWNQLRNGDEEERKQAKGRLIFFLVVVVCFWIWVLFIL